MSENKERVTIFIDSETRKMVDDFKGMMRDMMALELTDSMAIAAMIKGPEMVIQGADGKAKH